MNNKSRSSSQKKSSLQNLSDASQQVTAKQSIDLLDPTSVARDRCTVTLLVGPNPGAIFTSDGGDIVFGRGALCNARIHDPGLSRRHARVFQKDGVFLIEDLGSTNGTFINSERIANAKALQNGDRIQLGGTCLLQFHLQDQIEQEAAKKIYESSVRDPLTGLFNRRFLDERLRSEFAFAKRHQTNLSMILLDIDYFKKVNDSLGHVGGDAVLQGISKALQKVTRAEDVLARYGGEEFCIVVRGIERKFAAILAERLRKTVAGLVISWGKHRIQVTFSAGVATFSPEKSYPTLQDFIHSADEALYAAKNQGRNRCCIA